MAEALNVLLISIQDNSCVQDTVLSSDLILDLSAACLRFLLFLVGTDAITAMALKK